MDNYYHILQVPTDAPLKDIRDSYKRLAIALHPDKNKAPDATAAFQLLNRAYETLKSESQRATYDLILFEGLSRRSPEESKTRIPKYDEKKQPGGVTESNFTNFKDTMYEEFDFNFENFSDEPKSAFHPDTFDPRAFGRTDRRRHPNSEQFNPSSFDQRVPSPPLHSNDDIEIATMEMELRTINESYETKLFSLMAKIGCQVRKERGMDVGEDRLRQLAEADWEMTDMRWRIGVLKEVSQVLERAFLLSYCFKSSKVFHLDL
jgi:curved DNA-binding protein CbpA